MLGGDVKATRRRVGGGFVPGNFKLNDAEAEGVEMIETDLRRMS